jgi:hypothetical protein
MALLEDIKEVLLKDRDDRIRLEMGFSSLIEDQSSFTSLLIQISGHSLGSYTSLNDYNAFSL